KFATKPLPIGSETLTKIVGIVRLSRASASTPDGGLHNDHIGLLFDDLLRHSGSIDIAGDPAIIGTDISAGHPAKGLQPFTKRGCMALSFCIIRAPHPYDDLPHMRGLLRVRRKRPRHRASAEQRDELAALYTHSITSSARANARAV